MPRGYDPSKTSVYFMNYHFVWCPKYRRPVLVGEVETKLKELIQKKVEALGCKLIALETMPDHVHLFVEATPTITPNKLIGIIKGYTAHELRKEFPYLKSRLPTLWTRSYFVSTHGHVSSEVIQMYIKGQKGI